MPIICPPLDLWFLCQCLLCPGEVLSWGGSRARLKCTQEVSAMPYFGENIWGTCVCGGRGDMEGTCEELTSLDGNVWETELDREWREDLGPIKEEAEHSEESSGFGKGQVSLKHQHSLGSGPRLRGAKRQFGQSETPCDRPSCFVPACIFSKQI